MIKSSGTSRGSVSRRRGPDRIARSEALRTSFCAEPLDAGGGRDRYTAGPPRERELQLDALEDMTALFARSGDEVALCLAELTTPMVTVEVSVVLLPTAVGVQAVVLLQRRLLD